MIDLPDGRALAVIEAGDPARRAGDRPPRDAGRRGPVPGRGWRTRRRAGIRLIGYDRAGYGDSRPPRRPQRGRRRRGHRRDRRRARHRAASPPGAPRAAAARAGLRGAAAATGWPPRPRLAGAAPYGEPDLDFLAGMGEDNVKEFGAALEGEDALRAAARARSPPRWLAATPEQLADADAHACSARRRGGADRRARPSYLHDDVPRRHRARRRRLARRRPRVRAAVGLRRRGDRACRSSSGRAGRT